MKRSVALSILLAMAVIPAATAGAGTFNIPNGDVTALIDAINAANADPDPAVINLAAGGTYTLTTTATSQQGLPTISSEITINGNGAIIQRSLATGVPNFRIFGIGDAGEVTMNDLTVRRGFNAPGAGIDNSGELTLNNCTITENVANAIGGGIQNVGILTINESAITDNEANRGAGIDSAGANAVLTVIDSTISGNTVTGSSPGGGIYNSVSAGGTGGIALITNSTISDNATTGVNSHGGGIYNNGQMTITGGTITGNTSIRSGGGIYATHGGIRFLDVTDTVISGNTAEDDGGGIFTFFGSTTLTGVTISGNTANGNGGGIIHGGTGSSQTLTITDSLIAENTANIGGGIFSSRPVDLADSVIRDNTAPVGGGGIAHTGNALALDRTTVADNSTEGYGGGLLIASTGAITLDACTVSGNVAGADGGGIYREGLNIGRITATNSTISGNTAAGDGGGIKLIATGADRIHLINATVYDNAAAEGGGIHNTGSNSGVAITNSIVAGSVGGDIVGGYVDVIYNLVEDGVGLTNVTSMDGDPLLGPLRDNGGPTMTHALRPGSIAIDAGDCSVSAGPDFDPVDVDQIGCDRPHGAACDIGAVERIPGDLNGDCVVGGADLGMLLSEWGSCADCEDCPADLTGNCQVGGADLGVLLSNWSN